MLKAIQLSAKSQKINDTLVPALIYVQWGYFFSQDMDTSSPAVFVNAELLPLYVGRKVRAVVQVIGLDGGVVTGKSVDEQQLIIKGCSLSVPVMNYMEVIGIADGNQSIRAEILTDFGNTFGIHSLPNSIFLFLTSIFMESFLFVLH